MILFETLLALPAILPSDLYQEHQAVWKVAAAVASNGEEFLYCIETVGNARLVRLRSQRMLWGSSPVFMPRAGKLAVRMVCSWSSGTMAVPIRDAAVAGWFARRMMRSGFAVSEIEASPLRVLEGRKGDHRIRLPVRDISCRFAVSDANATHEAFSTGMGRAKRFGCGMLRVTG
jgi:hypothetical protein